MSWKSQSREPPSSPTGHGGSGQWGYIGALPGCQITPAFCHLLWISDYFSLLNSKALSVPHKQQRKGSKALWSDRIASYLSRAQGETCSEILGRGEGFPIRMELGRREGSCRCLKSPSTSTSRQKRAHHNRRGGSLLPAPMARRALAQRFSTVLMSIHHCTSFMPDQDRPTTPNWPAGTTSPAAPALLLASVYLPTTDKPRVKL